MSTNRKIALIATLATLVAAPAFALDQDTAATTVEQRPLRRPAGERPVRRLRVGPPG